MKKILIVDDEPLTCQTLGEFFQGKGYEPITASGGEEALSKVDSEKPLVMLLDVPCRGWTGWRSWLGQRRRTPVSG